MSAAFAGAHTHLGWGRVRVGRWDERANLSLGPSCTMAPRHCLPAVGTLATSHHSHEKPQEALQLRALSPPG